MNTSACISNERIKQMDSFLFVDNLDISDNLILRLVTESNLIHMKNEQLATQTVEELKRERKRIKDLIDALSAHVTPSSTKTKEELEEKAGVLDSVITSFEKYLRLEGISYKGALPSGSGVVLRSQRSDLLKQLIEALPLNEKFDIAYMRAMAQSQYPSVFLKTKKELDAFYSSYWTAVNEAKANGLIGVDRPGKAKRSVIFIKIGKQNKTK